MHWLSTTNDSNWNKSGIMSQYDIFIQHVLINGSEVHNYSLNAYRGTGWIQAIAKYIRQFATSYVFNRFAKWSLPEELQKAKNLNYFCNRDRKVIISFSSSTWCIYLDLCLYLRLWKKWVQNCQFSRKTYCTNKNIVLGSSEYL